MSCACENRKYSAEIERIRTLAKAYARLQQCEAVVYRNSDGTYGFCESGKETRQVIEYISPY